MTRLLLGLENDSHPVCFFLFSREIFPTRETTTADDCPKDKKKEGGRKHKEEEVVCFVFAHSFHLNTILKMDEILWPGDPPCLLRVCPEWPWSVAGLLTIGLLKVPWSIVAERARGVLIGVSSWGGVARMAMSSEGVGNSECDLPFGGDTDVAGALVELFRNVGAAAAAAAAALTTVTFFAGRSITAERARPMGEGAGDVETGVDVEDDDDEVDPVDDVEDVAAWTGLALICGDGGVADSLGGVFGDVAGAM